LLKKKEPVKKTVRDPKKPAERKDLLLPFKEELVFEWRWLMKKLHIYDYEKEDNNLYLYRKFRGWE